MHVFVSLCTVLFRFDRPYVCISFCALPLLVNVPTFTVLGNSMSILRDTHVYFLSKKKQQQKKQKQKIFSLKCDIYYAFTFQPQKNA